jgi:NADPH:quinone reductase-like Zn-dependent oxidoreductase
MAKKRKKAVKAVSSDPEEILGFWLDSLAKGLDDKKLDKDIEKQFRQPLLDQITKTLANNVFGTEEEKNTRQVAKDTGKICKMLTTKTKTISPDKFAAVFRVVRTFHDVCPQPGSGIGGWCELP